MKKIHIYRNGICYSGTYLDEEIIKTEEYEDFDRKFCYMSLLLKNLGYEVVDKGNNPFKKTEQFIYCYEEDSKNDDYVYVQRVYGKPCNEIAIGIYLGKDRREETSIELIKSVVKYQDLKNILVRLFRQEYEVKN